MVFGKLFSRLISQDSQAPREKPALTPLPLSALVADAAPVTAATQQLRERRAAEALLLREEILDARNRLCGYRFGPTEDIPQEQFMDALAAIDLASFARRRLALVPVTPQTLQQGSHQPLQAPRTTLLLDLQQGALSPRDWQPLLQGLKDQGFRIGVRNLSPTPEHQPLLALADLALMRLDDYDLPAFQRLLRKLKQANPTLEIAVENVPSWPERRMCGAWGADYCLGPFSTLPDSEEPEGKLDESRLVLMEMLNLLRSDADLSELGAVAKKDPGIALQVLALANSPAAGLASPVSSLEQAIMVLGRERLYRWLTVAMFRVGKTRDRDEALLEVAMTRARFLETVGDAILDKTTCDELFLVGLLSLFDVLLAMPLAKALESMHLAEHVSAVLLRSEGPYARYLQLALAVERGRSAQAGELAASLGIAPESLGSTSLMALAWAEEALGISAPDL